MNGIRGGLDAAVYDSSGGLRQYMRIRSLRLLALTATLALTALFPLARHTPRPNSAVGPKPYYLALGDSLSYGYQPNLDLFQGYASDFFHHFATAGHAHLIDMGCVLETTTTMINGGCPFAKYRKYKYSGPQLAAAVAFIQQHPSQVSPVTIDIGANDLLPFFNASTCAISSTETITQIATAFDTNFNTILTQLKTALNGTGDLYAMNYYMPYQNQCPNLLPYLQTFNQNIAAVAQANGVPLADVFTAFGGATTPNPNICNYTWICSSKHDVHPTTKGYTVIAQTFESLAGYKKQHRPWHWWRLGRA